MGSPYGAGGPQHLPQSPYGPHPQPGTGPYQGTIGATAPGTNLPTIQLPPPGTPAYTPDYSSMIGSSWEVGAAEAAMASQMAAARQQFQSQLRSSFVDLGYQGDQSQLGDMSKYIDKDTIQKAIDNKYSAYAQIKQQEGQANAANNALLASSGMGVSGAATETTQNTINQAEQSRYDSLRNFLSGGQQGLAGLGSLQAQLSSAVLQARFAAAQRLAAMYPPTPEVPAAPMDWQSYPGGTWSMPGGGYITQSGIPGDQGQPQPWYVGGGSPGGGGSATGGDLSWLNPHV